MDGTSSNWMFRRLVASEDSDELAAEAFACYQQWLAMKALGEVRDLLEGIEHIALPRLLVEPRRYES